MIKYYSKRSFVFFLVPIFLCVCMIGIQAKQIEQIEKEGNSMELEIKSTAFEEGGSIPRKYTCDGTDISPPLSWTQPPEGTKSLVLICDDPDAPMGTWVHWVLYSLSPDTLELPEDVPDKKEVLGGAMQGTNDFRRIGYGGPCPPSGTHRYYFTLYAIDSEPGLGAGATKKEVLTNIEGHVLAEGQLMGRYSR
jgi:Raf kinase inhibitor-like YbhB/YbcL family protein